MNTVSANLLARTFDLSVAAKPYKAGVAASRPNALDGSGSDVTLKISQASKAAPPQRMSIVHAIQAFGDAATAGTPMAPVVLVDSMVNIQAALKSTTLDKNNDGKSDLQRLADAGILFKIRSTDAPTAADTKALELTAGQLSNANLYSKLSGAMLEVTGDLKGLDMESAQMLLKKMEKGTLTVTSLTSLSISDTGVSIQKNLKTLTALTALTAMGGKLGTVTITDADKVRTDFKLSVDQALSLGKKLVAASAVSATDPTDPAAPPQTITLKQATLTVQDSAKRIEAKLVGLNDINPDALKITDGSTLRLTVDDIGRTNLLKAALNSSLRRIDIKDGVLQSAGAATSLLSLADQARQAGKVVHLQISGAAGDVADHLETLDTLTQDGLLKRLAVTGTGDERVVKASVAAFTQDSHAIQLAVKGGARFAVNDTAANISAGLDSLQDQLAKRVLVKSDIQATDAANGAAPIDVSADQLSRNADVISRFTDGINLRLVQTDNRVHMAARSYDAGAKIRASMVNQLIGTAGDDVIAAGLERNNVTIRGGGGADTAMLAGNLADYTTSVVDAQGSALSASAERSALADLASGIMNRNLTYSFQNGFTGSTVTAQSFSSLGFYDDAKLPWDRSGNVRPVRFQA